MNNKKENRILVGPGGCLTREAIELYIDGALNDSEKKKLLRHTRNCEICSDALEGAAFFTSGEHFSLNLKRLDHSPWRQKFDPRVGKRKLFVGVSSVAASIALLLGIYFIFQIKNVIDKEGGFHSGQDVATIGEVPKDSLPIDKLSFEEALNETKTITVKKEKPIKTKQVEQEPDAIVDDILIIEDDEMEIDLAEEIAFAEEIEEEVSLEKTVVEKEKTELISAESASQSSRKVTKAVDLEKVEVLVDEKRNPKKKFALKNKDKEAEVDSYYIAEVMPMFQGGGIDKFNKYLEDSLKVILPDSVLAHSIIVGFRVDTDGNVDNVKLINGTSSRELNKEIIRLVKQSPMWIPAQLNGEAIAVDQQLEVVFNGK